MLLVLAPMIKCLPTGQYGGVALKTSFEIKGTLFLDGVPGPFGRPANRNIFYVRPDGTGYRTIGQLQDLAGRVAIRSPGEALNFVRLRGSPALLGALKSYDLECETLDMSRTDDSMMFGLSADTSPLRKLPPGMFGCGNASLLEKSHVEPAKVEVKGGDYEITRTLFTVRDLHGWTLVTVRETVGPTGTYRFKVLKTQPTRGLWGFSFPA